MKSLHNSLIVGALLGLACAIAAPLPAPAQNAQAPYPYPRGMRYDPKTVVTVAGTVVSVDTVDNPGSRYTGIHLTLKTAAESLSVHLGPKWYFDQQTLKIAPGDALEVTGSRITYAGAPALLAAKIKKGDALLVLRDANGLPRWARSGAARP